MRINADGQITIPVDLRDKTGLLPDTEVTITANGTGLWITKRNSDYDPHRGDRIVDALRGKGDVKMTTDEIMALTRGD